MTSDGPKKQSGAQANTAYQGQLGPKYRAIIPKAVREVLHLHEGDTLVYPVEEGQVILTTRQRLAQQLLGSFKRADGLNLTQALLRDRRTEAEREE